MFLNYPSFRKILYKKLKILFFCLCIRIWKNTNEQYYIWNCYEGVGTHALTGNPLGLKSCYFIKNRLQHKFCSVNIAKLLTTAFFVEDLQWLLLYCFPRLNTHSFDITHLCFFLGWSSKFSKNNHLFALC